MAQTEMVRFIWTTGVQDVELTKPMPGETTVINGVTFSPAHAPGGCAQWRVTSADGRELGDVLWQSWFKTLYFWSTDGVRTRKGWLNTMLGAFGALVIPPFPADEAARFTAGELPPTVVEVLLYDGLRCAPLASTLWL